MTSLLPFFDSDDQSPHQGFKHRRFRGIPIRTLVPNLITLLAFCMGLTAIRMGIEARYELAVVCIIVAAVLDSIDGHIARMLKSTSRFGAELDSLSDLVSFGVAPIVLLYSWSLKDLGSIGWIGMMCFAIASALRLARFNTMVDISTPKWCMIFCMGVPAPAGAFILMLPLYISHLGFLQIQNFRISILLYVFAVSFMMVTKIPTFSSKIIGSQVPREFVLPLIFGMLIGLTFLLSYPWFSLVLGALGYWLTIPLSVMLFQRLKIRFGDSE